MRRARVSGRLALATAHSQSFLRLGGADANPMAASRLAERASARSFGTRIDSMASSEVQEPSRLAALTTVSPASVIRPQSTRDATRRLFARAHVLPGRRGVNSRRESPPSSR